MTLFLQTDASATQQLCENIRELMQGANKPCTLDREAQNIEKVWYPKLYDRKRALYLTLRNANLYNTYEAWRNSTPNILPQQLQMCPVLTVI